MNILRLVLASSLVLLSACATHIVPTISSNPPPARALHEFEAFELQPLTAADAVKSPAALKKIDENLVQKLAPLLAGWNKAGGGDTLVIAPQVQEIKFVGAPKRVFLGVLQGSSAVRLTVRLSDKASGDVIAEPEFFQRANAMGGAYTFGATDNLMLIRIASVVEEYLRRNYDTPVGGPTGLEAAKP